MLVWPRYMTFLHQNWVTWPGPYTEYIFLFWSLYSIEILIYSIINCRFSGPVARQPMLPWQTFSATIIGGSSSCQPPRMKLIGSSGTELRHILAVYIMCQYHLDLWPIFSKIGAHHSEVVMNICAYLEVYRRFPFRNMRPWNADLLASLLGNRRCHENDFVPHSLEGRSHVSRQVWSWFDHP